MPAVQFQPHSCPHCQKLVIRSTHQDNPGNETFFRRDLSSDKIVFDFTFKDLKAGGAKGCALCRWILESEAISRHAYLNDNPATSDDEYDLGTYQVLASMLDNDDRYQRASLAGAVQEGGDVANDYTLIAATSPPFKIGIGYMSDVLRIEYFGLWDSQSRAIPYRTHHGLQCFAEPHSEAAKEVSTRPIESSPESSLPSICDWLGECLSSHAKCREMAKTMSKSGVRPLRLLHVDPSNEQPHVRLQETKNLQELPPYVALSYCWGGDQPVKCTTDVLAEFLTSISFAALPATIQDAIKVCLRLGHRFLWIDALCIVQNDDNEKATEISKMPFIYGHAAFTVAASRASSVHKGFLSTRIQDSATRAAFALPCVCSDGQLGMLNFVDLDMEHEPIDSRGWTLQERLLSPRIVEFGSRQTRWTCQEDFHSDGITDGWRQGAELSPLNPKMTILRVSLSSPDSVDIITLWNHLVEIYTERKLTQSTDRPWAISGIAEWLGHFLGDEYLAGSWKSHLHTGLLWAVQPRDRCRQPKTYQGPSWSWLSVSSPVWFHTSHGWSPDYLKIQLLSSSLTLVSDSASYGPVREGSATLRVKGKLARARLFSLKALHPDEIWIGHNEHEAEISGQNKSGACRGMAAFYPDCEETEGLLVGNGQDVDTLRALEIWNQCEGPTWSSHGIVLQPVADKTVGSSANVPTFSRLGTYIFEVDTDNCQREDESDEEWEQRIDLELNWFRNIESTTLDLV